MITILLLLMWFILCCLNGLINTRFIVLEESKLKLILFLCLTLGNLLWIFIIYKQEALKTFNFIILWMTIHGVGTNIIPLFFKQVQLTKKQIFGLIFILIGVLIIWLK